MQEEEHGLRLIDRLRHHAPPAPDTGSAGTPWVLVALPGIWLTAVGAFGIAATITVVGIGLQIVFIAFFARHLAFAISALQCAPQDLEAEIVDTGFRPPVAVIVACKNEEQVIRPLVTSLLALDYPVALLQVIVVNDGSTDRTERTFARSPPRTRGSPVCTGRPLRVTVSPGP